MRGTVPIDAVRRKNPRGRDRPCHIALIFRCTNLVARLLTRRTEWDRLWVKVGVLTVDSRPSAPSWRRVQSAVRAPGYPPEEHDSMILGVSCLLHARRFRAYISAPL